MNLETRNPGKAQSVFLVIPSGVEESLIVSLGETIRDLSTSLHFAALRSR
jgi:hypothetical protein